MDVLLEIIIIIVVMVFAIPLTLLAGGYVLSPKIKAFVRGRALVRIIDKQGREVETTAQYLPGKGEISVGKRTWQIDPDDVITSFPSIPIITVDAEKGKTISWTDRDAHDPLISSFNLQALIISVYAAARSGMVAAVEFLKTLSYVIILIGVIGLVVGFITMMNTGTILAAQSADHNVLMAMYNASINASAEGAKVISSHG